MQLQIFFKNNTRLGTTVFNTDAIYRTDQQVSNQS